VRAAEQRLAGRRAARGARLKPSVMLNKMNDKET
jgi:hypothetical protein